MPSYFLAIGPTLSITKWSHDFWDKYYCMTCDIGADQRGHTARASRPVAGELWRACLQWHRSYAYWRTLPAALSRIPYTLREFISERPIHTVLCNHYFNLPIAARIQKLSPKSRLILETHDLQSNHFADQGQKHPLTRRPQNWQKLFADEIATMDLAEVFVHLNDEEAKLFSDHIPNRQHVTIFPSLTRKCDNYAPCKSNTLDFLIVAAANPANFESISWFLHRVWSDELNRRYSLRIVGDIDKLFRSRAPELYRRYRKCFEGRVDDTEPFYRDAGTVLLPTISGHGISIKTIEALSYGKPLIGTPLAFRGFERHVPESLRHELVTSPHAFREQIIASAGRAPSTIDPRCIGLFDMLFSKEMRLAKYSELLTDYHKSVESMKDSPCLS